MGPKSYPPGREHLPAPEIDEHGARLTWSAELSESVISRAEVMNRAARRTAGINDAIAASEDGSYWADE